jgi:hypothetical protein
MPSISFFEAGVMIQGLRLGLLRRVPPQSQDRGIDVGDLQVQAEGRDDVDRILGDQAVSALAPAKGFFGVHSLGLLLLQAGHLLLELVDQALAVELEDFGLVGPGFGLRRVVSPGGFEKLADMAHQDARVEGFAVEAVGPQLHGELFILLVDVGGRVEDERETPPARVGPDRAAELVAVHDRHQDVRNHQIPCPRLEDVQGFLPIGRFRRPEACPGKEVFQKIAVLFQVVDDEDVHGVTPSPCIKRSSTLMKTGGSIGFSI